jgi:hypothetical protein
MAVSLAAVLLASCVTFAGSPDSPDNEELTEFRLVPRWSVNDSITGELIASGCKTPLRIEAEIGRQITVTKTIHQLQADDCLVPGGPNSCGFDDPFWCSDNSNIEEIQLCVMDDPACWTPMENGPVVILEQEILTPLRDCRAQPRAGGIIGRGLKTTVEVVGTGMMEFMPTGACTVNKYILLTILPPGGG